MIRYSFTRHADRQLKKLPVDLQQRVIRKIKHYIETGTPLHFADSIEGERGKVYRFRIGDYRVIFDWEDNHLLITQIAPRARIY